MTDFKTRTYKALGFLTFLYLTVSGIFFFQQEKLMFHPNPLEKNHRFETKVPHYEHYFKMADGTKLHGVYLEAENPKGLVYYYHGNTGDISTYLPSCEFYVASGFDVFLMDYRGFGKSDGKISSEQQFLSDALEVYKMVGTDFTSEEKIIIGYSIGTAPAAYVASKVNSKEVILLAPFTSMHYLREHLYPWLPSIAVNYPLDIQQFLKEAPMPVTIFHGLEDNIIPFDCALQLRKDFKEEDQLFPIPGQDHMKFENQKQYRKQVKKILHRAPQAKKSPLFIKPATT
ncbi:alpha/beta hydrolase [Persicobacter diffluens]|uniref:Alpha/beta hydrolase n=1 Tax=Persicobacter diffluens TaxID=981 RepID=A0AAN4VYD4_9BACT|nr:alpha/beta hydrolase [Persicobacter diffluens]